MIHLSYSLPAFILDFPAGSPQDDELSNRWNINVTGWIWQAMPASPSFFYDPSITDIPAGTASVLVQWNAFPNRLLQYFSDNAQPANPYNLNQQQLYELGDTGYCNYRAAMQSFPNIPETICPQVDWQSNLKPFGPYGPRGWLDEYCEWASAKDSSGRLLRVDFCCENPEYWNTLWKVSPERVAELYQNTLNADAPAIRAITVDVSDLELRDINDNLVIDPETARPAYNPLNKWNCGPEAIRTGDAATFRGGAMHLTSTPNTLQTELGLAGGSTVQYQPPHNLGNSDPQALICCGNYGQEYRHSDPHIGQVVNQLVGGQALQSPQLVCLANPVGLYIQTPADVFQFGPHILPGKDVPADASPSDVWQVVRGAAQVTDSVTNANFPGNMILHAVCQIPSSWLATNPDLTLADMMIDGQPIQWGAQIAAQLNIGLFARPIATSELPPSAPCSMPISSAGQPLQCMYAAIWDGHYLLNEPCPTGTKMSLASNTTFVAPQLPANGVTQQLVLTCAVVSAMPTVDVMLPDGSAPDSTIRVAVTEMVDVVYAVPGNSYPGPCTALYVSVTVPVNAVEGLRGVKVTGSGIPGGQLPAALYVKGDSDS